MPPNRQIESRYSLAAHAIGSAFAKAVLAESRRRAEGGRQPSDLEKAGALLLKDVAAVDHPSRRAFQRRNAEAWRRARAYAARGPGRTAMRDLLLVMARSRHEAQLKELGLRQMPQATVAALQMIPIGLTSGRSLRADARRGLEDAASLLLKRRRGANLTPAESKRVERCWALAAVGLPSADHIRLEDAERRAEHPQALGTASARARHRRDSAREMDKLIRARVPPGMSSPCIEVPSHAA